VRSERVSVLVMRAGPSRVDALAPKPRLAKDDGQMEEFDDARTLAKEHKIIAHRVMQSPWKFERHGDCGRQVSELFPLTAEHVDDLCFLHGVHTEGIAHGPATLFLHTGATNLVRPSAGSWVLYRLGTESQNRPGFVPTCPSMGNGGPRNWSTAFLPTIYQGTPVGRAGTPTTEAKIRNLTNDRLSPDEQRQELDLLQALNAEQLKRSPGDAELEAGIDSYGLAFPIQAQAPGNPGLSKRPKETPALC